MFVAGGYMNYAPDYTTYTSVVIQESVQIDLIIDALNNLQILYSDVINSYLSAPFHEKFHIRCIPELVNMKEGWI